MVFTQRVVSKLNVPKSSNGGPTSYFSYILGWNNYKHVHKVIRPCKKMKKLWGTASKAGIHTFLPVRLKGLSDMWKLWTSQQGELWLAEQIDIVFTSVLWLDVQAKGRGYIVAMCVEFRKSVHGLLPLLLELWWWWWWLTGRDKWGFIIFLHLEGTRQLSSAICSRL